MLSFYMADYIGRNSKGTTHAYTPKTREVSRAIYEALATTLATLLTRTPDPSITRVPPAGELPRVTPAIRVVISVVRSEICSSTLR